MTAPENDRLEPTASPFAQVLHPGLLSEPLRTQFLEGDVVLTGAMDFVWHRPPWLRPLFRLLARWDVLFPETGCGVPAEMRITARDDGTHMWARRFSFTHERRFDAVMAWDGAREAVVERTGPFEVQWGVRALCSTAVEIRTDAACVVVGRRRLCLPPVLVPRVVAVERSIGPREIHIQLTVSQPPLGDIFGYSGTFAVRSLV